MLRIAALASGGLVLMILILCVCICCVKKKNDKIRKQEQIDVQGGTYISTDESDIRHNGSRNSKVKNKKSNKSNPLSP